MNSLYKQIPPCTACKKGCNDCCGPVPVSGAEAKVLGIDSRMTPVKPGTLTCAFWDNGCTVYEKRPFMCRLFGSSIEDARLKCPHGVAPLMPLSRAQAQELSFKYMRL